MKKKLVRSKNNRVIAGVLGGIADYFHIDVTIVRVVFIIFLFISRGTAIGLYLILSIIMPNEKNTKKNYGHHNPYYEKNNNKSQPVRKEAEKVDEDDWSDF